MKEIITICISTRNRKEGLIKLLNSISKMDLPDYKKYEIRVVVVENDSIDKVSQVVDSFRENTSFEIKYFLETNQGLCYARNRTVLEAHNSTFCVFVDDDQIVDSKWMVELVKCKEEFDCDAVYGSNPPIFEKEIPDYMQNFYKHIYQPYGSILNYAATNCLLIRYDLLINEEGPFDLRLNFLGGEDMLLTTNLVKKGCRIISNPNAVAFEMIPSERLNFSYIIKRSIRNGNTNANFQILGNKSIFNRLKLFTRYFIRLIFNLITFIPRFIFDRRNRLESFSKIFYNSAAIFGVFSLKVDFYK